MNFREWIDLSEGSMRPKLKLAFPEFWNKVLSILNKYDFSPPAWFIKSMQRIEKVYWFNDLRAGLLSKEAASELFTHQPKIQFLADEHGISDEEIKKDLVTLAVNRSYV